MLGISRIKKISQQFGHNFFGGKSFVDQHFCAAALHWKMGNRKRVIDK